MKKVKTFITLMGACMLLFSCGSNASAQEVKIGTQTWSTKNLNVSTFRNGDSIPEAKTAEEWQKAGEDGKAAWCYYDNDPENGKKYGKLYNWFAVNDSRGLAPQGWHVPSDAEWTILTDYLGGDAGTKMKSTSGWNGGIGTNASGFAGFPCGCRDNNGGFSAIGGSGSWWSSSEYSTNNAWSRDMSCFYGGVSRYYGYVKEVGLSVRCLRDF